MPSAEYLFKRARLATVAGPHNAGQHMQTVKASDDEEGSAELGHAPRIAEGACAFADEMRPFICLATEKDEAAADRRNRNGSHASVAIARCGDSHCHHGAAADQHECHERDQPHIEDLRLNRPPRLIDRMKAYPDSNAMNVNASEMMNSHMPISSGVANTRVDTCPFPQPPM